MSKPSYQTANNRARFVLALFRASSELEHGIDEIFRSILMDIRDGDAISYHMIAFGPSEPYLDCLETVGLPRWTWFPEIAKHYLTDLLFCHRDIELFMEDEDATYDEALSRYWRDYFPGHRFKDHGHLEVQIPRWDPETQDDSHYRKFAMSLFEEQLKAHINDVREHAPKLKATRDRLFTEEERLSITARRFCGHALSRIARDFSTDDSNISRTARETCERLAIEPCFPKAGRPTKR